MLIGNHLSASKGYAAMGKAALKLGANTFAFFTRNPRGGKAKDIDEKDVEKFLEFAAANSFGKLVSTAIMLADSESCVKNMNKVLIL